jgi:hypothetical protein
MSYVRWSSIIGADLTIEEQRNLYTKGATLEDELSWCIENKNADCYLSDWYIFWHSMGGDESEKREDQYLSMWNCNEERTPTLDYMTVKQMLETDDWSPLGYETITQKEVLVDCVKRWLSNVEKECE